MSYIKNIGIIDKSILTFGFIIMILCAGVVIKGCNNTSLDTKAKVNINKVIKKFSQYDLTKSSDRINCLQMLQQNYHITRESITHEGDQTVCHIISNMIQIIDQFRLELEH